MSRINVLLTGVDSAETRSHALTDTLMVASIDPVTHDVALISFPRDVSNFPLVDGGIYKGKINSYMTYVNNHPKEFKDKPLVELVRELSFLVGAPIHYYAAVDLAGFRKLVDAAGGVTVNVETALDDRRYDWLDGRRGFKLSVGKHTLNGEDALAYVRSRYTPGDNDFRRAKRQQEVLLALARKMATPADAPADARADRRRRRHAPHELPVGPDQRDARPRAGDRRREGHPGRPRPAVCLLVLHRPGRDLHPRAQDGQAGRAVDQDLRVREHLRQP